MLSWGFGGYLWGLGCHLGGPKGYLWGCGRLLWDHLGGHLADLGAILGPRGQSRVSMMGQRRKKIQNAYSGFFRRAKSWFRALTSQKNEQKRFGEVEPNTANDSNNIDSPVYWRSEAPIPAAIRDRKNYYTTLSEKDVPTSAVFVKSLPVRKMASVLRNLFWN